MKKKFVLISNCPHTLLNFRRHLLQAFVAKDYLVVAMTPPDANVALELDKIGVRFVPISLKRNGNNPINDILSLISLTKAIRREQPDIVLSCTIKPMIYGTLAAKIAKVPRIYAMVTGVGYAFRQHNNLKQKIVGSIAKRLLSASMRHNNKIFFQNNDDRSLFLSRQIIDTKQATVLINGSGVDLTHFAFTPITTNHSFLMVARLLYDKGIREFIAAARLIKQRYPNVVFRVAGGFDSNPNAVSESELAAWVKEGCIEYLGKLDDVRPAIIHSSVFILPSYGEGTPRSVLEAMSVGRPIITTDVPGCRETVMNGKNGFLIPACNVDALCNSIEHFIKYPHDIELMGNMSRVIAVEKYDVHKVNQVIMNEME